MWPITGSDLTAAVLTFLTSRLLAPDGMVAADDFEVRRVAPRPDSDAKDPALVTFMSLQLRDEVKQLGRNLRGSDRTVGLQIEPPDHLRSHYQALQKMAFEMKRKFPSLRRNIKFYDMDLALVMDVQTTAGGPWKTVGYEDAKIALKRSRARTDSFSLGELEEIVGNGGSSRSKRRRESAVDSDSSDDNDSTIVDLTESTNNKQSDNSYLPRNSFSFINTNARSIGKKAESLFDCFQEKDLDLALVTETWMQDGRQMKEMIEEYSARYSLGAIMKNRNCVAANGRQYGGVAIIYRKKTAAFKEFRLVNPECHEVLAAVGNVKGIEGKVFVLACYAPPNLTQLRSKQLIEFLSNVIQEAKRMFRDCLIIVGGDFNQWPITVLEQEHPSLTEINHGPTRGDRSIDRTLFNFGRSIVESGTLPPLETEDGHLSDHRVAWARAELKKIQSGLVTYSYRDFTDKGAEKFQAALAELEWDDVLAEPSASIAVDIMQTKLDVLTSECFPWKTTTKRDSDPPWINDRIRWLVKKRRKIYDREGRSVAWKRLKKKSDKITLKRATKYMEKQKRILTAPDAARSFFKNVKAYRARDKPPDFDVRDLFPGSSDVQVADKLSLHFNAISSEFEGLTQADIPSSHDLPLPRLEAQQVEARLKEFRKPKSMVRGDIFPCLVNDAASHLAIPLTSIYNKTTSTGEWPSVWKTEYVTPIPKKAVPESPDDLRNISCTQLLSKIYESFVLEWLSSQVELRSNQFGGVKGSGSEHFLVTLWQKVLENAEDPRAASVLTSIDYSKAFNRLDFKHCLRALKAKGACTQLLKIVASFLSDRNMLVKIGNSFSEPRKVMGGVPQGSLLGVLLFNIAIDDFESPSADVDNYGPDVGYVYTDQVVNAPQARPVRPEPTERDYRHLPPWHTELLQVLKYVDDNIIIEKVNFDSVPSDGDSTRTKLVARTENLFKLIVHLAESRGMKVNGAKTKSICISELKGYLPKAFFVDSTGNQVQTSSNIRILGFEFSSDIGMQAQVEEIKKGFRVRQWILTHLAHCGFSKEDLLRVYRSVMLPVHDYCSCVYNSSLTLTQASALERLQARALKCIYGYQYSYRSLLQMTGLQTLQERRDARCDKFAAKCLTNPRYMPWFPRQTAARNTRSQTPFREDFARTKRLYNSPIFHMRRRLNGRAA